MVPWYVRTTPGLDGRALRRRRPPAPARSRPPADRRRRALPDQGLRRQRRRHAARRVPRLPDHRRPAPALQRRRLPHRSLRRRRRHEDHHQPAALRHQQPAPLTADRTVSCHHWWLSWRLQIPDYWSTGAYVAVLTTADGAPLPHPLHRPRPRSRRPAAGPARHHLAGVQPLPRGRPRPAPASTTPGTSKGRLLGEEDAAVTVSFDRPYAGAGLPAARGPRLRLHPLGRALRLRPGLRRRPRSARRPRRPLAATAASSSPATTSTGPCPCAGPSSGPGTAAPSLVFLSANTMYWQVELDPLPVRRPRPAADLPQAPRPGPRRPLARAGRTGAARCWASSTPGRSRAATRWSCATPSTGCGRRPARARATNCPASSRARPTATSPARACRSTPSGCCSHTPRTATRGGARRHQETSLYRAPSGALVFSSGTFAWSPALDRPGHVDSRVQRATANLLDRICKGSLSRALPRMSAACHPGPAGAGRGRRACPR